MNKNKSNSFKNVLVVNHDRSYIADLEIIKQKVKISPKKEISTYEYIAMPFFIDSHLHGGYGFSTNDLALEKHNFDHFIKNIVKEGLGGVYLSTVTTSETKLLKIVQKINELNSSFIYGIHLEGPFISPGAFRGAHDQRYIKVLKADFLAKLKALKGPYPIIITLAPEEGEHLEIIKNYSQDFIFALGHTNANSQEVRQALKNGAQKITHLYNGMHTFDKRRPGLLNALLSVQKRPLLELISDGVHVHPEIIKWTYDHFGAKQIVLITDSLKAKGTEQKSFNLGTLKCEAKGFQAYLEKSPKLAGSLATYNYMLKQFHSFTQASWEEMVCVSSYNLALQDKFQQNLYLQNEMIANFVIIDRTFKVFALFKNGNRYY